jgi:hypothetical protein
MAEGKIQGVTRESPWQLGIGKGYSDVERWSFVHKFSKYSTT